MKLTITVDFVVAKVVSGLKAFCRPKVYGTLVSATGLFALMFWASPARGQNYLTQTGTPTFTTVQPVELGFINLGNGNLHLTIPLGSFPQRGGRPFTSALVYDSRIWQLVGGTWQPTNAGSQGGWRLVTSADAGSAGSTVTATVCKDPPNPGIEYDYTNFTWTAPDGTLHTFYNIDTTKIPAICGGGGVSSGDAYADDASGYHMYVTNYTHASVIAPDGTTTSEDTNGNYLLVGINGNVTDTLGRTPVTYVANGTGCSTTYCYNVLNSQGSTSQVKVTTQTINVSTNFGQYGQPEYSGTVTVLQSIQLPDGTSYQFTYDSGSTAGHYGELTGITLPTLGQITYGYTNFTDAFGNHNMWVSSRISGGGTWSYTPSVTTGCESGAQACQQVIIAKPSGDNAVYTFSLNNGAWKSQVQSYTGAISAANLVSTTASTWDFSQPCVGFGCTGASNIRVMRTTTTLPTPGSNNVTSKTEVTYAGTYIANPANIKEWKFYAGSSPTFPTIPDRETDFTYLSTSAYTAKNILDRVLTKTVKDSGGNVLAQTNYSYDDSGALANSSPATGIQNHDDTNYGLSNTVRGNRTKIQRCTVLTACSSNYVQTAMTYDTTGQVLSVQDPNGNTTNLAYGDSFCKDVGDGPSNPPQSYPVTPPTNAYLTTVSPPLIPAATFSYYYGTGQVASATDGNGRTTYSHFFDAFSRPTSTVLPNGGWSYEAYNAAETQVDAYIGITGSFATSGCTGCRQDEALLDSLGRVTTQKLMSDPEGITSAVTNYDTSGRLQSASHPYRGTGDSTYGFETPAYDGLNRTITVTHPDSTYSQTLFGAAVTGSGVNTAQWCSPSMYGLGFPVLAIDEAGKKREVWSDGWGRTIEADEPDSSGNLTSNTCYAYDPLGNLTQIVHGTQTRRYGYDTLSRITSVTIPELANASGSNCNVTYTYDSNSNLQTRTTPAPNQTTCTSTVTTTLYYDALNRLTKKTYSDGSATVQYGYDGTALTACSTNPPTLTDSNLKGRMTAMCDASGATSWSHDALGRVLTESRTILGVTKTISYAYNLDGSIVIVTYPNSKVVTYTVSNAQRLTAANDVTNNVQFATAASYAPPGGLQGMISGKISGGFGGITESHTFNNSLEYTSTQATSTTGTALNLTLNYNLTGGDNGTVTGITNNVDSGRTQSFTYDPLNRILSAKSSATSGVDCWGQNFGPDGNAADDAVANLTKINSGTQAPPPALSVR